LIGFGADLGIAWGLNVPPNDEGEWWSGLWEFPSINFNSTFGTVTTAGRFALALDYAWEWP
jgi:hypothetical protein